MIKGAFIVLQIMSINGGSGGVLLQNIQINNQGSGDCLTAVKHGNGRDWWVINKYESFTAPNHFNRFFVYFVTGDSIYAPITQDFNDATDVGFQKVIWNATGSNFMQINAAGYMSQFDFNRCTGIISLQKNIFPEQTMVYNRDFWEGAYSPSNNVFYVSTSGVLITDTFYLLQYNLLASNISQSADTLESFLEPQESGQLRIGIDGKIYFSRSYNWGFPGYPYPDSVRNNVNENLSVINSPDSIGAACNYQPFSFYLGGKRTYYGLPNNPNYELGPLVGSPCDTLTGVQSTVYKVQGAELLVYYHSGWQKLFVNAQNIKGKDCLLQIFDVNGKEMYSSQKKTTPPFFTQDVSLEGIASGMYLVTLTTEKEKLIKKFVKN